MNMREAVISDLGFGGEEEWEIRKERQSDVKFFQFREHLVEPFSVLSFPLESLPLVSVFTSLHTL